MPAPAACDGACSCSIFVRSDVRDDGRHPFFLHQPAANATAGCIDDGNIGYGYLLLLRLFFPLAVVGSFAYTARLLLLMLCLFPSPPPTTTVAPTVNA